MGRVGSNNYEAALGIYCYDAASMASDAVDALVARSSMASLAPLVLQVGFS